MNIKKYPKPTNPAYGNSKLEAYKPKKKGSLTSPDYSKWAENIRKGRASDNLK